MSEILKNKNKIDEIENLYKIFIFVSFIELILILKVIDVFFFKKVFHLINYLFRNFFVFEII